MRAPAVLSAHSRGMPLATPIASVDEDLIAAFASELSDAPEAACAAETWWHERSNGCSGTVTHLLIRCNGSRILVCDNVTQLIRQKMSGGGVCTHHKQPIREVWRLIPV